VGLVFLFELAGQERAGIAGGKVLGMEAADELHSSFSSNLLHRNMFG
jgi:hypothetical protein